MVRVAILVLVLETLCFFKVGSANLFFEPVVGVSTTPNTSIYGITKDALGYMWFGSWNGLYRYDGTDFERYYHTSDPNSLPNNRIKNIITSDNGELWIACYNNLYARYNYSTNKFVLTPEKAVPNEAMAMLTAMPRILNHKKFIDKHLFFLKANTLTGITSINDPLVKFRSNPTQPGSLLDDFVTSFYIDNQKILWVGTRSGMVFKANSKRQPFNLHYVYRPDDVHSKRSVRTMLKYNKQLWLGTNHNGIVIKENNQTIDKHPIYKYLPSYLRIRHLATDKGQNIWIATSDGIGVYDAKKEQYTPLFNAELFPDQRICSVFCMASSNDKNFFWAGSYNALLKINTLKKEMTRYKIRALTNDKLIMSSLVDKHGNVWLGTEGNGLIRLTFDIKGNIADTLVIDDFGKPIRSDFKGNMIYALFEDKTGQIWIGTADGLVIYSPISKAIKQLTRKDGLSDDYISAITSDANGSIWASHKEGISKVNPDNLQITNYGVKANNNSWTFLDGACYNDTTSNTIYFGAREGYISFKPDEIESDSYKPKLMMTKLYVSGQEVTPGTSRNRQPILKNTLALSDTILLNYNNRNFSLDFTALHYPNPDGILYNYQLEGYDEAWRKSTYNKATYIKVPAGTYRFKAFAVALDGNSSEQAELTVIIRPPWYATPWAIGLFAMLILGVFVFIYRQIRSRAILKNQLLVERLNIEKQEEVNREKLEFFTNVSHELRTPLTLITDPIKQLQKSTLITEENQLYCAIISRNITHLSRLITQLLDFRKAETGKLKANYSIDDGIRIVQECVESFYMNANHRNIHLNFHANSSKAIGEFDKSKMDEVFLNLISNAFKYTPNGGEINVNVETNRKQQRLIVEVVDNGIGIERKSLTDIFKPFNSLDVEPFEGSSSGIGLALTRNLVTILKGEIVIESTYQEGTKAIVSFPYHSVEDIDVDTALPESELANKAPLLNAVNTPQKAVGTKSVVLVVEDNPDIQTYLSSELGKEYVVYQEFNGQKGLKSANVHSPDIIISDIMMPKLNGIEFCKQLKKDVHTSSIPVILLTAKSSDQSQIEGFETGADAYISKPFSVDVLKAQVNSILENRARLQNKLAQKQDIAELEVECTDPDKVFLQKVIESIRMNLGDVDFNSESLASILKLSSRQLYCKLKAISGNSIQDFIVRVKMEEASNLLLKRDLSISQVAYHIGFSEPNNFSRAFKKYFGCSPSQYLNDNGNK